MVVLALLTPDGARKGRSAQKSNVLGGELIKCFQTSKKKKKISSGRVQVLGSSFRDPWDSFVVRPLTHSLKSYPRELIESHSLSSQPCPFFVLCGPFVTEWTQNPAASRLLRKMGAKSQKNSAFIQSQMPSSFSTLPSPFLLKSELQMADPCADLFSCRDSIVSSCFCTWKPFKDLADTPSADPLTDEAGKNKPACVWETKKFQDFYLVLSTFQMLSSVADLRDGILFFWVGSQASLSRGCKNNSWHPCWGFSPRVPAGLSLGPRSLDPPGRGDGSRGLLREGQPRHRRRWWTWWHPGPRGAQGEAAGPVAQRWWEEPHLQGWGESSLRDEGQWTPINSRRASPLAPCYLLTHSSNVSGEPMKCVMRTVWLPLPRPHSPLWCIRGNRQSIEVGSVSENVSSCCFIGTNLAQLESRHQFFFKIN